MKDDKVRQERLLLRALAVMYAHANGHWLPVMRHLAFRGEPIAMLEIAAWLGDTRSAMLMYRRAFRAGDANAAQHLAMNGFNRRDLIVYRYWLRRAARAGDDDAGVESRRFETRLPHLAARHIRRQRPLRRSERA